MFPMLGCRVSNTLKNQIQGNKLLSNRIPTTIHYSTALENDKNKSNESFETTDEEEFRQLDIPGLNVAKEKKVRVRQRTQVPPPRHISMKVDQDWTNVWPAASTFKWSAVPFPVRQGLIKNKTQNEGVPPGRYANAELMKIPNFLHLTPAHIKKHCAVLKKFCSPWPKGLDTDKKCKHHFPVTIKSSDYLRSSPSIRDPRARIVDLKIKLSSLDLDYHARDKIIRLSGNNYDKKTDTLTLEGDRCPLKIQNEEYVKYLLSALYFESRKKEPWEKFKEEIDWEKYFWDLAASKGNLLILVKNMKQTLFQAGASNENTPDFIKTLPADFNEEQLINTETVQQYKSATTELHNEGENHKTLTQYKDSVIVREWPETASFCSPSFKTERRFHTSCCRADISESQSDKQRLGLPDEIQLTSATSAKTSAPVAPDPDLCCMSGCTNCVWIEYLNELRDYYPEDGIQRALAEIDKIDDPTVKAFIKLELTGQF